MYRNMLRSKIHRATVTGADLHYEGSVTIDADLLERADILPHEEVEIWNVTNGERFRTYALAASRARAWSASTARPRTRRARGDLVIIATFGWMTEEEARAWEPKVVFVDDRNRPVAAPRRRATPARRDVDQVVWQ